MAIKKIITVPNPVLKQKSKPVKSLSKKTKNLIKNLKDTLKASSNPKGVGLSACQIGILKQVFIIQTKDKIKVLINPKIISLSKKTLKDKLAEEERPLEGCLSIPGIWGFVNRPVKVKVSFLNSAFEKKTEEFKGKEAICVQHEIDHLNGVLFTEKILKQKGKLYKLEENEKGEKVFVEL